jgi:hypothetical protein
MQGNDVRMSEFFEDLYLAIEILLQFLVQSGEFDGLDGDCSAGDLSENVSEPVPLQTVTQSKLTPASFIPYETQMKNRRSAPAVARVADAGAVTR